MQNTDHTLGGERGPGTGTGAGVSSASVARRRVFYVPGFDPFPPRRYRELYRREAALQAGWSGHRIALQADPGGQGWTVTARIEGRDVEARFEVLVWADLVQASMGQGIVATYLQLLRTVWTYVGSGAIFRIVRLRKGPAIAALYPILALLAELAIALGLGALVFHVARTVGGAMAGLVAGLAVTVAVLWLFRKADGWLYAWYLMHDYAHTAQAGGAYPADLSERLQGFTQRIGQALAEAWDEVLVVGHSSGAHLAVTALADLLRSRPAEGGPALSVLTLGHVVPMVTFLPRADRLRADLRFLSAREDITWIDVTAPGDGCAFALCDPVAVSGVAPLDKRWPLVLSAAFTQTLSPGRWRKMRWRFFRLHFQYLCAFDRLSGNPGDYDYFAVTAGPLTLGQRFAMRSASPQRIETALSRHRGLAPEAAA